MKRKRTQERAIYWGCRSEGEGRLEIGRDWRPSPCSTKVLQKIYMYIDIAQNPLFSLNFSLSPWPRWPRKTEFLPKVEITYFFSKELSRWALLHSKMGNLGHKTGCPPMARAVPATGINVLLRANTIGVKTIKGRKVSRDLFSGVMVVMEFLSLLISCPALLCPFWIYSPLPHSPIMTSWL